MSPTDLPGETTVMIHGHPTRWRRTVRFFHRRRLTLFGRSVVLIGCEILANVICWAVTGILFAGRRDTQPILGLALLAWVCPALPLYLCLRARVMNFFFLLLRSLDDWIETW
jgi:hypothetical protein